ncbi:MAG: amidohydrolase family protein [Planctomycetaceae bacterium]
MRRRRIPILILLAAFAAAGEDPLVGPPNGPGRADAEWHLLRDATVHVAPGETLEAVDVEIRDGRIVAVGASARAAGPRVWAYRGLHLYAALIDAHVEVEAPRPDPREPGLHWNSRVLPQRSALDGRGIDPKAAEELRSLGFGAAAIAPKDGVFRGSAALVSLGEARPEAGEPRVPVYAPSVYQSIAFEQTGEGEEAYPNSQMGAIALIRQCLSDAAWLAARGDAEPNALRALSGAPALLFRTEDELEALRAAKVAREFTRRALLLGSGTEFRRLEAIRRDGLPVILPLDFPPKPEVDSVGAAESVELSELMTWEQAPTNPRRLDAAGVRVALTTSRLRQRGQFLERLRTAMRHGLTEERALAMLTTHPAEMLGAADRLGAVRAGLCANLIVADGPLFAKGTKIRDLWIDGRRHEITPPPSRLEGEWALTLDPPLPEPIQLLFGEGGKLTLRKGEAKAEARGVAVVERRVSFTFEHAPFGAPGVYTLSGVIEGDAVDSMEDSMRGGGVRADGSRFLWSAARTGAGAARKQEEEEPPPTTPELPGLPFGPYALASPPPQPEFVVIRGATIWTCGPRGIVAGGVLVASRGKIVHVGKEGIALPPGATVVEIDGTGLHLTPGILDCHSHTGISKGVNESGQAVTAEVRIEDVTNPDAIGWYRQLAGGVTAVSSLHGSANPIGGQNCVNKIRWGCLHPDDMHFEGAPPGIKFALGENVKQSNWGDQNTTRYPQTRMGVETILRDRFLAAREYRARTSAGTRRDLELEALAEVLEGKRLVHCHSYRQDEILMLCRVAEEFAFTIGTFQHVLEGYKVADAIRARALGGSSFTDWWAYKVEVQDAIPHNGALMHEVGVCVSFNSDSDELARRLNTEAAKAVKYGGASPEEALMFVTINPARQLRIEARVGSLEPGKDADFALWSGDPLSTATRCVATWIDGREYFSLAQDAKHRAVIAAERTRLLQKALSAREEKPPKEEEAKEERPPGREARFLELLRRGVDPEAARCGVCGCEEEMR